jgi:hypothetical protein
MSPGNILVNTTIKILQWILTKLGTYLVLRRVWNLIDINRVPDSPKDYVCAKFGQNPLKDIDSRVFTKMLFSKNLAL